MAEESTNRATVPESHPSGWGAEGLVSEVPEASEAALPDAALPGTQKDEDTRARLLAVAGPIFANLGYDRATVRQICRVAKVNLASICYHFGDKMGLYVEVIRDIRHRRDCNLPLPKDDHLEPAERLRQRIRLLLSRMLREGDERSWETQLLMREMHQPTAAFSEMVEQTFKPMMEQLCDILERLMVDDASLAERQRLAFSVIGQCLYYQVGKQTVRLLIPEEIRRDQFSIDALTDHITKVTVAAARVGDLEP